MSLKEIFFMRVLLARAQHLLPGGGFENHAITAALTGRFNRKTSAQQPQISRLDSSMFIEGG